MIYAFGAFELDSRLKTLRRDRQLVRLEPKVFDMLSFLAEEARQRLKARNAVGVSS